MEKKEKDKFKKKIIINKINRKNDNDFKEKKKKKKKLRYFMTKRKF